jgi:hypothetical protein
MTRSLQSIATLIAASLILLFYSCKKDTDPSQPTSLRDQLIGEYIVTERATTMFGPALDQRTSFDAKIIRGDSIDYIEMIQSARTPRPAWVGWSSDTLIMKIYPAIDSLRNPFGGIAYGRIFGTDSIKINYWYGASTFVYDIYQTWVKK